MTYGARLQDVLMFLEKEKLNFPTPSATDATMPPYRLRKVTIESAKKKQYRGMALINHLGMFPEKTEEETKENLPERIDLLSSKSEHLKGLKMNPDWIEWLMGYPRKWTDITIESKDLEMRSYLKSHILSEEEY